MNKAHDQREAQRCVDRARDLREYLNELAAAGILELSLEQRTRLDQHLDQTLSDLAQRFDVDITESQRQLSLGMRVISALGGLALCAAVFLFFYRFWGLVSTPVQVIILVVTPMALLASAEFAATKERTLYFAALLGVVAFAAFVLNLTLLGSIFNVTPSHRAFLPWCAFALILAYHFGLKLPLVAGLLCFLAFLAATMASWRGWHWFSFGERPENFLPAAFILLAAAKANIHRRFPEFPAVYRCVGLLAIFVPCLILANSGDMSYLPLGAKPIEVVYETAGFALAAMTIWWGISGRLSETVTLGAGAFTVFLFNRLVAWWWDYLPKYLFFLLIGLIALGLLSAFRKLRVRIA
jgi:hypothetical protein